MSFDFRDYDFEGLGDYPEYEEHKNWKEEEIRAIAEEAANRRAGKGWGKFFLGVILTAIVLFLIWWQTDLFDKTPAGYGGSGIVQGETVVPNIQIPDTEITIERAVAEKVMPSMVGISTTERVVSFFGSGLAEGVGSGVIVDSGGFILTNAHVVANGNAESITVRLANGDNLPGELLWVDQSLDLAIVKVERNNLVAAELGDSDGVRVGDKAIAIGNPLGLDLQSTLTSGYISGLNRQVTVERSVMSGLIQSDAAINKGNSGGALLNSKGELIGINTIKNLAGEGIGFAIPINIAKPVIKEVVENGEFHSVYVGIYGADVAFYRQMYNTNLPEEDGVIITQLVPGSGAERAGIKVGDVLVGFDGRKIDGMNSLKKELLLCEIGDQVNLTVIRDGKQMDMQVTLLEQEGGSQ